MADQLKFVLILLISSLLASAETDIDFLPPWENNKLPKACYAIENNEVKCYRISHDKTAEQSVAKAQCTRSHGRLATHMTDAIWANLWDVLIVQRGNIYEEHFWLGAKIPAYKVTLVDPEERAFSLPDNTFWTTDRLGEPFLSERCSYVHSQQDKSRWFWQIYPSCVFSSAWFYICEYTGPFTCNVGNLYSQVPNANFKPNFPPETVVPHGTSIEIECWDGYQLIGSAVSTCDWKTWINIPQCLQGCPSPEKPNHAALVNTITNLPFKPGDKATFVCDEYHFSDRDYAKTHFSIFCLENGEWSDTDKDCVSNDQFETVLVDIDNTANHPITLNCDLKPNPKSPTQWKKDDGMISSGWNYEILSNGTLTVARSESDYGGVYSCYNFLNKQPQIGKTFYQLVGKGDCDMDWETSPRKLIADEGDNVVFACVNSTAVFDMRWFKHGIPIWSNVKQSVLPNGELLLNKVTVPDVGLYTCQAIEKGARQCEVNVTYDLTVTVSALTMCKKKDSSSGIPVGQLVQQPWLVTFWHTDKIIPFCYGTVIDNQWVLTTAACLAPYRGIVNLGITVKLGPVGHHKVITIEEIKIHPKYRHNFPDNDIALAKMEGNPLKFTYEIYPACIPEYDLVHKNSYLNPYRLNGTVVGWGSLEIDYIDDVRLSSDKMAVAPKSECQLMVKSTDVSNDMFCANRVADVEATYAGDNGSPFLVLWKQKMHVMGIYNWGQRTAQKGRFDYFTNVTYHYQWIKNILAP